MFALSLKTENPKSISPIITTKHATNKSAHIISLIFIKSYDMSAFLYSSEDLPNSGLNVLNRNSSYDKIFLLLNKVLR